MSKTKAVLGRGLASLIPRHQTEVAQNAPTRPDDGTSTETIATIPIDRVERNPYQPRTDFDQIALDELKQSIIEKGIIQPVTVRRIDGGYQLISGERRLRAAREAGLTSIPAYIIAVRSNEEMLELALIENLQREHLNPIEIAISYKRLIDECRYTQEEVSQRIGKDRTTITNFLRLLRLPDEIQSAVRRGDLSSGHARALVTIDDNRRQLEIFRKAVAKGMSVREVERLVRDKSPGARSAKQKQGREGGSSLSSIEERLRQFLGTKVQIRHTKAGRGEIVIEYYSNDDLNRLIEVFLDMEHGSR